MLSSSFPNVRHLFISRGHADISGVWIQTEHIVALTSFSALQSLVLESISRLRPHELHVLLHDLPFLQSLSLPEALLSEEQSKDLVCSPNLTSLRLNRMHLSQQPRLSPFPEPLPALRSLQCGWRCVYSQSHSLFCSKAVSLCGRLSYPIRGDPYVCGYSIFFGPSSAA